MGCLVCKSDDFVRHTSKELMYGLPGEFVYHECSRCGLLELQDVPENMHAYYPRGYYSFRQWGTVRNFLKKKHARYVFGRPSLIGFILSKRLMPLEVVHWFSVMKVGFEDRILDVGCGWGALLHLLAGAGFKRIAGIDPYIEKSIDNRSFTIHKKELSSHAAQYDVIMLNHSFEHMTEPRRVLGELKRLLSPKGRLLIRIPVAAFAWREFNTNWVSLDAPRHIYIFTERSFRLLAAQEGFDVVNVEYDSSELQFWASEQYRMGIHLESENSHKYKRIFTDQQIGDFAIRAKELNEQREGDQACFYLELSK